MMFLAALFVVAVLSGATASLVGFGIGSLLTPLLALKVGTDLAVAAVALPHAVATALRCWRLRREIDWQVLKGFGLLSAVGGLSGAFLYSQLDAGVLQRVLGGLLVLTAAAQLAGLAARWHPRGPAVGVVGFVSGFFGGIAGNQGGLRAAALTALCSMAEQTTDAAGSVRQTERQRPSTARLSASVPPPVNTISRRRAPSAAATRSRASSNALRACRPQRCTLDGLP